MFLCKMCVCGGGVGAGSCIRIVQKTLAASLAAGKENLTSAQERNKLPTQSEVSICEEHAKTHKFTGRKYSKKYVTRKNTIKVFKVHIAT